MKDMIRKHKKVSNSLFSLLISGVALTLFTTTADAKVRGECSNCHTMHNSQNGNSMAWDNSPEATEFLTRGGCVGCHAQNTSQRIITLGLSEIPQVSHTDPGGDLAAGNFGYLSGIKGSGASDAKGHNVVDLGNLDDTFTGSAPVEIPGGIKQSFHDDGYVVGANDLTCAGTNGCHGYRMTSRGSGLPALAGSHHNDVEGQCDVADDSYNSYRFLIGVRGYENQTDKWQNVSPASHNEYYGSTSPPKLGCSGGDTVDCHGGPTPSIQPPTNTISGFCATCHGNFHTLSVGAGNDTNSNSGGIGADILSPFIRHPTDIVIKNEGEYTGYTTYNVNAPVGRTTVPASASSLVVPGTDVVTCLSCHMAHASDYPDMLRWDYEGMLAHDSGGDVGQGCFICHTTKDDY